MASSIQGLNGALPDQQIDLVSASKISGTEAPVSATPVAPTPATTQGANDATDLHRAISSLPLFPWLDVHVTPLAQHHLEADSDATQT